MFEPSPESNETTGSNETVPPTSPIIMVANPGCYSDDLTNFLDRIFDACGEEAKVVVSMHEKAYPQSIQPARENVDSYTDRTGRYVEVLTTRKLTYLDGMRRASTLGEPMDPVIEIDIGGHLPEQIPRFVQALETHDIALSTRFALGGSDAYPWQRKLPSQFVTLLSNWFLGTNLTDASSGFEGFRSEVLRNLFEVYDIDEWLALKKGPYHMYQTEMRALVTWMVELWGYSLTEVPITYGTEKSAKILPISYFAKSLACFMEIAKSQDEIKSALKTFRSTQLNRQ